jgi:hypothetical protein
MNDVDKDIASTIASAHLFFSWRHLDLTTIRKSTIVILQSVAMLKVEVAQKISTIEIQHFCQTKPNVLWNTLYNAFGQISLVVCSPEKFSVNINICG